jgi:hypothetical protein
MRNLSLIEEYYRKFINNVFHWIPEGIYFVDLELLHHFDLLHFQPNADYRDPVMNRYFHMIESVEKITLINDEFIVWIIPDKMNQIPVTCTLIALNRPDREPQLEAAFIASGVYNTSKLVLKVLEKFLIEIQETGKTLSHIKETA